VVATFTKHYTLRQPGSPALEACGLRWLGAVPDGARVARVIGVTDRTLELERLPQAGPAPSAAEAFGRALARTHAAGAPWHGCAPAGWEQPTGSIGLAPLAFTGPAARQATWGEFYAACRVEPFVQLARQNGEFSAAQERVFAALCERLREGLFDAPQPGLVGPGAARLHGDLWSGNVLWLPPGWGDGEPWTGAALIDPAAHGGHAETDLAMLDLFGCPGLGRIVAAYHEVSPLAEGWLERVRLHQVFPLLVHACLFGGGYGAQAVAAARPYL
jgi:fructosamine-3-kinase